MHFLWRKIINRVGRWRGPCEFNRTGSFTTPVLFDLAILLRVTIRIYSIILHFYCYYAHSAARHISHNAHIIIGMFLCCHYIIQNAHRAT